MIPEVLDFRITSMCNMACPFCFGTKVKETFDYEKLVSFFVFLKEKGVKYIVITGGEPTLADRFSEVVKMLKQLGYQIALSTNGTFWEDRKIRQAVLENCSWIALPVDAPTESGHNEMRNYICSHFKMICSLLPHIRRQAPDMKIKIGTVVTRKNIKNAAEILEMLPIEPDSWKLFQLSHTRYNDRYYKQYQIEDYEFGKLIQTVKSRYQNSETAIHFSYEKDRNGRYIFLEPNGEIIVIQNDEEQRIGSYLDDNEQLAGKIARFADADRANQNFHNSFVRGKHEIW